MRKKSIAKQLFFITFIVMTLLIGAILLAQSLFFNSFYKSWKLDRLLKGLNEVISDFETHDWSYMDLTYAKQDFYEKYNAQFEIFDPDGQNIEISLWQSQPWYVLVCGDGTGSEYEVVANEYEIQSRLGGQIKTDTDYTISGMVLNNGLIDLLSIDTIAIDEETMAFTTRRGYAGADIGQSLIIKQMYVKAVRQATEEEVFSALLFVSLSPALSSSQDIAALPKNNFIAIGSDSGTDVENISIALNATGRDNKVYSLQAAASIQPIHEAGSVLLSYYPYFFAFVLLTSFLLALFYSKKVSKPLLVINKVAGDMAKLNFEQRLKTDAKNEFGSLSESLNTLAGNLDNALMELNQANEKLTEDIREKERQETVRREFVANVSHELKTPLGVMRCYLESLQDDVAPEKKEEYYGILSKEIKKMNAMVMQMLSLVKAEAVETALNKTKFNIKDMLEDTVTLYLFQAEKRGLNFKIKGDFSDICADYPKMEQVCTNLIGNAVNYSLPNGEITLEGKMLGGKNRIGIKNRCEPITQQEADKLWDRFYKADKSHKKGGTGLGLAIAAAILNSHNYKYGVSAKKGAIEFYFEADIEGK